MRPKPSIYAFTFLFNLFMCWDWFCLRQKRWKKSYCLASLVSLCTEDLWVDADCILILLCVSGSSRMVWWFRIWEIDKCTWQLREKKSHFSHFSNNNMFLFFFSTIFFHFLFFVSNKLYSSKNFMHLCWFLVFISKSDYAANSKVFSFFLFFLWLMENPFLRNCFGPIEEDHSR